MFQGGLDSVEVLWQRMDVNGDGTVTMEEIQVKLMIFYLK